MILEGSDINVPKELEKFIGNKTFPCVMAKAALSKGFVQSKKLDAEFSFEEPLQSIYAFVKEYRARSNDLSSFIFSFNGKGLESFSEFEKFFWKFIIGLKQLDQIFYEHDKRVGADPLSNDYSYSLMEEAFFLIVLHPQSPRKSRRYSRPSIVFNPHRQFENLREEGKFEKIRSLIRAKDAQIQKEENGMLKDYGDGNEIFQYTGRQYSEKEKNKLLETIREGLFERPKLRSYTT